MEWEKKFYDIIQETESNLARARRKLRGKCFPKDANSSFGTLDPVHQSHSSVQPTTWRPWDSALPAVPWTSQLTGVPCSSPSVSPTSEMGQLLSKIDSQNLMIDRLERLVKTLNQEKDQYRRHISDLRQDVGDISSRLSETRYMNPHLETQVDLMRQEVRSDMQRLQTMISAARSSSLQSNGLERSFKDMQYSLHAELEGIRRDLNFMSHRVGRLELDMSSHSVSQRDLHDRLNASVLTSASPSQLLHSGRFLGSQSALDVSPVKSLRSTVSELHNKLDSLEGQLAASRVVPLQSPRLLTGFRKLHKPSIMLSCRKCEDDDDDHDDEESSDLDDLDLSDLDLSSDDDDDVSDLSEDVEEIIRRSASKARSTAGAGLMSSGSRARVTLADLNLSSSDGSSERANLSDLDLDDLDLSSAEGSVDLDSVGSGGSIDLKLDDL
ncbi:uncharacterized protein LOC143279923 [Babylonia areolata]|uniref:uncharacterized protein LOC143279923 n=1 Tax=Babylonia areolata TaxID=304850 RepID=UPI003FCFD33C